MNDRWAVAISAIYFLVATPASATDNPAKASPWTGFYGGVNFGLGGNKFYFPGEDPSEHSASGYMGGVQLGYMHHFGNDILLGAETDFQFSNLSASYSRNDNRNDFEWDFRNAGNNFFGTVRGRVGYAWGRLAPYFTGGLAYGKMYYMDEEGGDIENETAFEATQTSRGSHMRLGYTLGGGIEYAINDRWRLKTEYLFFNFGDFRFFDFENTPGPLKTQFHVLRLGVNYVFCHDSLSSCGVTNAGAPLSSASGVEWSGLHFGINGGVASQALQLVYEEAGEGTRYAKGFGALGGLEGGFDLQLPGQQLVVGLAADYQWATLQAFRNRIENEGSNDWNISVEGYGTVRGRLGYALGDLLPFVTGGFSYGTVVFRQRDPSDKVSQATRTSSSLFGYTVGAGVEYAVTKHWSVKSDYQYVDLGKFRAPEVDLDAYGTRVSFSQVRLGVHYRF